MASDSGRAVLTHPSPGPLKFLTAQEIQKSYADQLRAAQRINLSVDLVLAAKRHLGFLRNIDSLPCLHRGPAVLRAIRRSAYSPSKFQQRGTPVTAIAACGIIVFFLFCSLELPPLKLR